MLNRVLVIVLVAVLYLPLFGLRTYFELERKQIQKEVKRKLMHEVPIEQLVELRFAKSTIDQHVKWKHSKEFEFKGEMYDVVYRNEQQDSLIFHCWRDKEETALNQRVKQLAFIHFMKHPDPDSNTNELRILSEQEYILTHLFSFVNTMFIRIDKAIFDLCQRTYDDYKEDIPSPPPELSV